MPLRQHHLAVILFPGGLFPSSHWQRGRAELGSCCNAASLAAVRTSHTVYSSRLSIPVTSICCHGVNSLHIALLRELVCDSQRPRQNSFPPLHLQNDLGALPNPQQTAWASVNSVGLELSRRGCCMFVTSIMLANICCCLD